MRHTDTLALELASLTDDNNHTEAALLLATFSGHPRAIRYCRAVSKAHEIIGDLPQELCELRSRAVRWALEYIERDHGDTVAEQMRAAL